MGLLEKGTTAILKVRSRVWAQTFVEVGCVKVVLETDLPLTSRPNGATLANGSCGYTWSSPTPKSALSVHMYMQGI